MWRPTTILAMTGALLVAGGCSLAPRYVRPAAPVPPELPSGAASTPADVPPTAPWQEFITDSHLRSVVNLVLANNRDLRAAALNAEQVGAFYRIQRAGLYPTVAAAASVDSYRVPARLSTTGQAENVGEDTLSVGLTAWEIDLFGRIRSLKEQALNQYLAAQQTTVATRTSIIATTASAYLALAADAENRALAESTLEAQRRTLDLIQRSRDAGVANDLDVSQAQTQVEIARTDSTRYAGLVELDRHALELLAGTTVPANLLPASLADVQPLKGVLPGLSSEVLLRRPDVLAAEYQLKAANANIGAARAAYFPKISLTTAIGLLSPDLSGLFRESPGTWNLAPQAAVPIFTGGALKANVDAARFQREAAIAQYQKAIQTAFREASDALSQRNTLAAERDGEEALVKALGRAYGLSEARYKAGIDNYLVVLVAQRSLFAAQQVLVGLRAAEQQNLVTLYKVLGGGVS